MPGISGLYLQAETQRRALQDSDHFISPPPATRKSNACAAAGATEFLASRSRRSSARSRSSSLWKVDVPSDKNCNRRQPGCFCVAIQVLRTEINDLMRRRFRAGHRNSPALEQVLEQVSESAPRIPRSLSWRNRQPAKEFEAHAIPISARGAGLSLRLG